MEGKKNLSVINTQKQLKRAIFSVKEKLSLKDLFVSRIYNEFLTQMAKGVSDKNECKALMFDREGGPIAFTDGKEVHINFSSDYTKDLDKKEKHLFFCGLNLHECGHVLFTDFGLDKVISEKLKNNKIYPRPENNEYLEEVETYLGEKGNVLIEHIFLDLHNCIEDGFVDRAVMNFVPGYSSSLRFVREKTKPTNDDRYSTMVANKLPDEVIFRNMVLTYARHGLLSYEEGEKSDVISAFEEVKEHIEKAVFNYSPLQRAKLTWSVFCYMFHFVKQKVDKQQEESSAENGSSNGNGNNDSSTDNQSGSNSSPSADNNTSDSDSNESDSNNSNPSQSSSQGTNQGNDKDSGNGSNGNAESNSQNSSGAGSQPSLEDALKNMGNNPNKSEQVEHKNTTPLDNEVLKELMSKMHGSTDPLASQQNSSNNIPNGTEDNGEQKDALLDALANKIAEEKVSNEQELALRTLLQDDANAEVKGIHRNVKPHIDRLNEADGKAEYEAKHEEYDSIVRRFIKDFKREIKERRLGDTMTGLYMGRRLNTREVYRKDKKIMSRKIQPEEIPDMAIGIMVDMSGSMSGRREEYAKACAYITYEFCRELQIPVFVVGHCDAGCKNIVLYSAVDENSLDDKDKYRIFALDSGGCNRDGYALRFCLRKLEKMDASQKLMFIISDGRPNSDGYGIAEGRADCQDAVSKAMKNGITTIAAGIGDAYEVKSVYKQGKSDKNSAVYMDLSNLEKLPKAFIKVIKEKLQ